MVFAALARTYPPDNVNRQSDPRAAANGQYLLVRRAVYERLGGHQAVATELLEDVALAKLFKQEKEVFYSGRFTSCFRCRNSFF